MGGKKEDGEEADEGSASAEIVDRDEGMSTGADYADCDVTDYGAEDAEEGDSDGAEALRWCGYNGL